MCEAHNLTRRLVLKSLSAGASGLVLVGCVPGGGVPNIVSPQEEARLGIETWNRIVAERPPSSNPVYQEAARTVSGRLVRVAGYDPRSWEVRVFRGDEANAFSLPGGKIGVYEGMFDVATNEDQLSTVVGHEVAHVARRHAAERISTSTLGSAGLQAVAAALQIGNVGYANEIAALLGAGLEYGVVRPYGRQQESEADSLGLRYMAEAGYWPPASIELWQRMERAQGGRPRPPEFLSTHPSPGNRIAELERQMPAALRIYERVRG